MHLVDDDVIGIESVVIHIFTTTFPGSRGTYVAHGAYTFLHQNPLSYRAESG